VNKKGFKKTIIALMLLILLSVGIYAFSLTDLWTSIKSDLIENQTNGLELTGKVFPEKVHLGQEMNIKLYTNQLIYPDKVYAFVYHDNGYDSVLIEKTSPTSWEGNWLVHNTQENKKYKVEFYLEKAGKTYKTVAVFVDPPVTHSADQITPGTFSAGDYTFPNNVTVNGTASFPNGAEISGQKITADSSTLYINDTPLQGGSTLQYGARKYDSTMVARDYYGYWHTCLSWGWGKGMYTYRGGLDNYSCAQYTGYTGNFRHNIFWYYDIAFSSFGINNLQAPPSVILHSITDHAHVNTIYFTNYWRGYQPRALVCYASNVTTTSFRLTCYREWVKQSWRTDDWASTPAYPHITIIGR